ncbi:MAG TPA: CHASE3 domain-containing protein, partial [Puia sp.]|nr:CHASE3 domain-containing protein [Puia sp.]
MVFLIVTFFIVGFLVYALNRNLGKTSSQISRTYEVISTLQGMDLLTTESGAASYRYLQTGDGNTARQIGTLHRQLQQSLATLRRLNGGKSDQEGNIERIGGLINDKIRSEDSLVATPAAALESRLAAADSTLTTLLVNRTAAERALLFKGLEVNEASNHRIAWLALAGRIA